MSIVNRCAHFEFWTTVEYVGGAPHHHFEFWTTVEDVGGGPHHGLVPKMNGLADWSGWAGGCICRSQIFFGVGRYLKKQLMLLLPMLQINPKLHHKCAIS
jgi:hypothetical protein